MKRSLLVLIRLGRRLFYNGPVHRSRFVNFIYGRVFHAIFPPGDILDVQFHGYAFGVPTHDITILPGLLNHDYENYEFDVMRSLAEPGSVFADVGANIGLFTVVIAAAVGAGGHVYAFEPEPENFAQLEENVARNRLRNVTAERLAIGAAPSVLTLHVKAGSIGTHTLLAGPKTEADRDITVEVTDLDSYFRRQGVWPDLVKVDVEGFEPRVFEGAHEVFTRCRYLFFEYARKVIEAQGIAAREFAEMLSAFPNLYRIDESGQRLRSITSADFTKILYANLVAAKRPLNIERKQQGSARTVAE